MMLTILLIFYGFIITYVGVCMIYLEDRKGYLAVLIGVLVITLNFLTLISYMNYT